MEVKNNSFLNEIRYYELFDEIQESIIVFDVKRNENNKIVDLIFKYINPAAANNFNVEGKKIIGFSFNNLYGLEVTVPYLDMANKMYNKESYMQFETYFAPLNKYFLVSSSFLDNNYITLNIDITERKYRFDKRVEKRVEELTELAKSLKNEIKERKKVELELKESEEKFRKLFNNANDMISLNLMKENGLPGKFIEVNDVGTERLGYNKDELLNMSPVDIVAPDKRVEMPKNAMELWTRGHAKFEIIHVAKNGKRIPVEVNNHLFKLKGKTVALAISRDIRERKKTEKEMKKLIDDLKRSNDELEQFAYIASHDLQEPLRTIASFTQLLERRYKGKFDNNADEFMDYVIDASIRMKDQIKGLLEFSRVTTREKTFKQINMDDILNHAIINLKTLIGENNAKITYDSLPELTGDADQLQRVFQNIISNAIKFRKKNEDPKVHISVQRNKENNEYIFQVDDNGIGIEKQYMERIFVIFRRLHTHEEYKGTGIGLSIVKRIIERHNGRIWVESEVSRGSTFYFTLPIQQPKYQSK